MSYKTEQESFWAGEFGNNYIDRNDNKELIASNAVLFSSILKRTGATKSIIEFGANIGMNLKAIELLRPNAKLSAIEINAQAVTELKKNQNIEVFHDSILSYSPEKAYDLCFIKGVLIHINPEDLTTVYQALYRSSSRYICVIEYYNPTPVEVPYRGHAGKLFKRDFAGEMLDMFKDLTLVDYGFVYHRDTAYPKDDLNWFLLEKKAK
ncbi:MULTISPECIES: pseudaminic acid biosynthesis-associated methylase [Shewanella]|uniref:pseudaminic acid biosynthesis-associated methylase n=1 Tax=Shewanella TaxID=22 RepID=UPI001BBB61D6|nr:MULTISPECIES: pseudaminic acid biosynthesis-associated methylase [Shewanella]GIU50575.1 hypothetical protein TUM4249_11680 [Shewanella sp. KT0246]